MELHCFELVANWQWWVLNSRLQRDWSLNPAPLTTRPHYHRLTGISPKKIKEYCRRVNAWKEFYKISLTMGKDFDMFAVVKNIYMLEGKEVIL